MSPIGPVDSAFNSLAASPVQSAPIRLPDGLSAAGQPANGFNSLLDGLFSAVDAKQTQAESMTTRVLLGDSGQLHQSVIAMQEASTALSLMVAVRNKLVESYQELMRMQV